MIVLRIVAIVVGIVLVAGTVGSAIRTMVVPRGVPTVIARVVFVAIRYVFRAVANRAGDYRGRDRVMALYAPLSLMALPIAIEPEGVVERGVVEPPSTSARSRRPRRRARRFVAVHLGVRVAAARAAVSRPIPTLASVSEAPAC